MNGIPKQYVSKLKNQKRAPMRSVILYLLFFRYFCMVCSRGPEPRKFKKDNKKLQTTCPQSQTRAPMGSAIFFLIFEVFAWFILDGHNLEKTKTKLQTTYSQSQTRAPMGSAIFFRGFCMVCSRWPATREIIGLYCKFQHFSSR